MANTNPQDDDIFLEGELVYLRQPVIEKDVMAGNWHSWFNDPVTTQFLNHGTFPVNREQQADIVRQEMANPASLMLAVIDKKTSQHIGVASLNSINHLMRTTHLGLVLGDRSLKGAGLESIALLTKHAFDRLNLQRVSGGHPASLWQWMNSLELIGFQLDGYNQDYGVRNGEKYDTVTYSITSTRYYDLLKQRGGNICTASLSDLFKKKEKINKTEIMKQFFCDLYGS